MIGEEDVARAIERSTWDSDFDFEESWLSPDYELVRHNRMIEARAAISAHLEALKAAGWKCVPMEPTDEMLAQFYSTGRDHCAGVYRDMIAVAPPPQNSDEVKP